jgi:hypothetical protein
MSYLCLNKQSVMKICGGEWMYSLIIVDLDICRFLTGKQPQYPLYKKLGGPLIRPGSY